MIQTLIHEMAHAKLRSTRSEGHDEIFLKELRRIRNLGAPLSPADVDVEIAYEPPEMTMRNVRMAVRIALSHEKVPWPLIPKYLEREFSTPFSEICGQLKIRKGSWENELAGRRGARVSRFSSYRDK
jgi:hypothetical protein